jgi:hypothetical protein
MAWRERMLADYAFVATGANAIAEYAIAVCAPGL